MRSILTLLLLIFSTSFIFSQPDLTSEQWQEDVRYIQHKILNEYKPLFHKITVDEWNKKVDDLYNNIPRMADHEVIVGIAEIIAEFGYGHTALWLSAWRYDRLKDFHQMPYNLYRFTDGVFVQGVHQNYEEAAGARVLKVGNMPIEEAIEAIRPVVSVENEQFFKAHGLYYLGVPEVLHAKGVIDDMSYVILTLEKNGSQFELRFTPRPSEVLPGKYGMIQSEGVWLDARPGVNTPHWLKHLDKKYYFEYIDKYKTLYVRQSEVQDDSSEDIPTFYKRVFEFIENNDVEKLVLDLRLNSGGNNYKNKPIVTGLIKSKINKAGNLFVILGRRTFSACQNLVNELENYTEAIFVGEPTAENVNFFGDSRTERLPNSNIPIKLSYLWWQDKDPRDTRPWTTPHVVVEMSSKDYISNRDPVLETILETPEFEKPIEPWDHLATLFMEGKLEELKTTAQKFVKDPTYKYHDFQSRINDAGDQLIGMERFDGAIFILKLNTDLYPDSPQCWAALAKAYWKSGDPANAKKYFDKVTEMDPEGSLGLDAWKSIKEINEKN